MLLTGQVYDNQTKQGIPYASVQITDSTGSLFTGGVAAAEDGTYELDSPALNSKDVYLYVSSTGYIPVLIDEIYFSNAKIGLDQAGNLPVAYVSFKPHENDWIAYLLFGGGLYLLLAYGDKERKKKRVTGMQIPQLHQNQWVDIALKIGIPVAIFFLIIKPILVALNLLPNKQEAHQQQSDSQAQNQQEQLGVYNDSDNHTYTATVLDQVAVGLRDATSSWYGYDYDHLVYNLVFIPGMTAADGRYFLGTFVKKNGYTLYRWYLDKFVNAVILMHFDWDSVVWKNGWGSTGSRADFDWSYQFGKLGINENNARDFSWAQVVEKFVNYAYLVAGVPKQ
jgi:hypothetical protein